MPPASLCVGRCHPESHFLALGIDHSFHRCSFLLSFSLFLLGFALITDGYDVGAVLATILALMLSFDGERSILNATHSKNLHPAPPCPLAQSAEDHSFTPRGARVQPVVCSPLHALWLLG